MQGSNSGAANSCWLLPFAAFLVILRLPMQALVGMPLRYLDLGHCTKVTDAGIGHLRNMPLEYLVLAGLGDTYGEGQYPPDWVPNFTDAGLLHLYECPLVYLNVHRCSPVSREGLKSLERAMKARGYNLEVATFIA